MSNEINAVIIEEVESSCRDSLNVNMISKIVFINTICSFKCQKNTNRPFEKKKVDLYKNE